MDTAPSPNETASASSAAPTPSAQVESDLATVLGSADSSAASSVQNLTLVHQARLTGLTRTAASVTAQYGAGSAQAVAAQAAVASSSNTVARVTMVSQQTTTPAPQVSATGWALYGRVFDSQLQPVSGFTVFLVDPQKSYQQAYGFAYTDATGYFLLSYSGTPSQDPSPGQSQTGAQLFLEIANTKAQPVYLSTTPFQPVLGSATYQNVTLPAGGKPIGDPPEAIRRVALPSQEKQTSPANG